MNLKNFNILFLGFIILLYGCIREDMSMCPCAQEPNLKLKFFYTNDNDTDVFSSYIESVDVFIYDESDELHTIKHINKEQLRLSQEIETYVEPANYRIICWGNVSHKVFYEHIHQNCVNSGQLLLYHLFNDSILQNDASLYYAPACESDGSKQKLTVSVNNSKKEIDVCFQNSLFNIEVFIEGFQDFSVKGKKLSPLVEISGLPTHYDFEMNTNKNSLSIVKSTDLKTIDNQEMDVSIFQTPVFSSNSPACLKVIKQSTEEVITEVVLSDFIIENQIDLYSRYGVYIPIHIKYQQSNVNINLPIWDNVSVLPELN